MLFIHLGMKLETSGWFLKIDHNTPYTYVLVLVVYLERCNLEIQRQDSASHYRLPGATISFCRATKG